MVISPHKYIVYIYGAYADVLQNDFCILRSLIIMMGVKFGQVLSLNYLSLSLVLRTRSQLVLGQA